MILEIPDLLSAQEIQQLKSIAARSIFVDGRISNPHNKTKNNQQIDLTSEGYQVSSQIMLKALWQHEDFRNFAFPTRIAPPMLSKYSNNMSYGIHCDNAFVGLYQQMPLRSDLSMTTFLNDPNSYDGGELVLHLESKKVKFKLPMGGTVVYPSTTLHEVRPVTRGERLVSIAFIESKFRDERQRHLLYMLGEVEALEGLTMKHENRVRLAFVQQNLQRMWS